MMATATPASALPANSASSESAESHQWLPPQRMRRYQWVKAGGGLLFVLLFIGWMWLQWSNPVMRWLAGGLTVITAWVTLASIIDDRRRVGHRQLTAESDRWIYETEQRRVVIPLASVARARWRHDDPRATGLWLFDHDDEVIAHLDDHLLGDEAEARTFIGWARLKSRLPFSVTWPDTAGDLSSSPARPSGQRDQP